MSPAAVCLKSIASFFVGGSTVHLDGLPVAHRSMVLNGAPREVNPNGTHVYGQMYVQEFRLAEPRSRVPVLLWHGGGMTGSTWESTPDGRPGWLWRFLEAGYDVLVSDAVERGRSSFAMYPQIYAEQPVFRTKQEGWKTFRMGPVYHDEPELRQVFARQRFPVRKFDEFARYWVPRWPAHESMILAAYKLLVQEVGPCTIVAHSQGAGFAAEVARCAPSLVRGVVALEPGGMPQEPADQALPPHLVIWGDHIEPSGSHWTVYRAQADAYLRSIADRAAVTTLDLPAEGIFGNSHFPMMDDNSDEIFARVLRWLQNPTCHPSPTRHLETTRETH